MNRKLVLTIWFLGVAGMAIAQEVISRDTLIADFRQFVSYLEETHPDPYSAFGGKVFFHKRAGEMQKELREKDWNLMDFSLFLRRFIAPLGDGHTGVKTLRQENRKIPLYLPLTVKVIPDGLILAAVPRAQAGYRGSKLLGVDGVAVSELADQAAELVAAENLYGKYENFARGFPDLHFLRRLIPGGDTVVLDLLTPRMERLKWTLKAVRQEEWKKSEKVSSPLWDKTAGMGNMDWRFLDEEKQTMIFRLHSVMAREAYAFMKEAGWDGWQRQVENYYKTILRTTQPEKPEEAIAGIPMLAQEFRKMLEVMKKENSPNLIIDLRGNGGGFTPITLPTIYQMYGDRYLQTDMGVAFYRLISPLYLRKINQTLADFNRNQGTDLTLGEYRGEEEKEKNTPSGKREGFLRQCIGGGEKYIRDLEGKPVYTPRKVFVVTDTRTFSAAFHYAFYLWKMGALVVGVPSSQAPNTFMETTPFRLPRTGIEGSISNSAQYFLPPADLRAKIFYPDWIPDYKDYVRYDFSTDTEIRYLVDRLKKESP